ncbi:MAG TPA: lycopene cyclase domain-containing protein [Candidatus Dormibacteraeota bacterium]|nr:lycopene cyclase domain-containing protein [Candidatus Dormibacteraeota bacterium]
MGMTRYIYLAAIIFSATGILLLDRRMRLGAFGPRLVRAIALTVPVFLVIDAVGAARGWFSSDPHLSVAILPPGISFEEPFLLTFLAILSVVLWRAAGRLLGAQGDRQ